MKTQLCMWGLLAVVALAPPAFGTETNYLPLQSGLRWEYGTFIREIQAQETIGGELVFVMSNDRDGETWDTFWTSTETGVWLHGFRNHSTEVALRYDPPILWIDSSAGTLSTWSSQTTVRSLTDDAAQETIEVSLQASEPTVSSVPAGEFTAIVITESIQGIDAKSYSSRHTLDGELLTTKSAEMEHNLWYASGVGLIRESFCCPLVTDQLTFFTTPVVVETASWGSVRGRF